MEDGENLRTWVDRQPEPQYLFGAAQPGTQFVQLEIRKLEVAEKVLVEALSVLPSAGQPGDDRGLTVAEDPFSGGWVQPFGERCQHHCDLLGRGFQTIQRGVASGSEGGAAGLAAKGLDVLGMPMLAISHQSVDVSVCDPGVRALPVRTGETLSVYAFGSSSSAFDLAPGAHKQR